MGNWMAYLYKQQPEPMNATGVPVTLTYTDPNNNFYSMGQTTSDINGQYVLPFSPTIPGLYTITATFGGTNSYYSSSAQTHLIVGQAAATTAPTPVTQSGLATSTDLMMYITAATIAIIIAIAVAVLILRKKP
jgi:hypothetical protein